MSPCYGPSRRQFIERCVERLGLCIGFQVHTWAGYNRMQVRRRAAREPAAQLSRQWKAKTHAVTRRLLQGPSVV